MSSVLNTPSPVPTPEEVVRQLRALREQIPEFVLMQRADTVSLVRVAHIDPAFIQTTINAVGASPPLQSLVGQSPEELQQETEIVARWSAVLDELDALRNGMNAALTVRRHRIGLTALQTYKVSQQLVRKKEHASLLPHVEAMRRRGKFLGGRRRVDEPTEPAPPAQT